MNEPRPGPRPAWPPRNPEVQETLQPGESRFGKRAELVEALERDPAKVLGTIEDLYRNIAEHVNRVEVVDLGHRHSNRVLGVEIQHGGDTIRCVFKPENGERPDEKRRWQVESLARREVAAFLIDRHFGFDLVPPTVYRTIDREPGALQLFIDPRYYDTIGNLEEVHRLPPAAITPYLTGRDYFAMALFDSLIKNTERKKDNFLVNLEDPRRLVAIDHGYCCNELMWQQTMPRGPIMALTFTEVRNRRGGHDIVFYPPVMIPKPLLGKLEAGLGRQAELRAELSPYLSSRDIDDLLAQGEKILRLKRYISIES